MIRTWRSKALLGLWLALIIALTGTAKAQAGKTFIGKVTEIARAANLDVGQRDIFYTLRLDNYPNTSFRLSPEDAVKFGVIEAAGPTTVVTPKHSKGLGWKVKLTCDSENLGLVRAPIYKVISLERLD
jgi:hypothetical protein